MTAQETNLLNAFETTLTGTIGASDLTITVNSVTDSASNTLAAPCYLVINPDSATNREVVQVTSINVGTKTLTLDNINKRYLTGSAATSGLSHASGSVVRMSPLQQHIEDLNDRVDTVINEAGTAVNTTLFLDEDNMASNSATKGVTQQSVKAYVDTQLTAEDLDISADSGSNIAIDLDSEVLDLEGGTGIDTATGTNKVTFAIDSTVATLAGSQALTNKTIDVDSNTVSNIEVDNLKSGVLDTDLSSTAGTDTTLASAKAIKTYVDTQITAEDLDVTADSGGPISIDLDSETLDIAGGTGIDTTASGNEISIAIDSTVVTESSTDTLTNKTIDADNNTVSNLEVDNLKSGVLDTDISSTAATDTTIPSAKAVKTYVDAQGTAQDLDITDGSTTSAVDLDSQTMTIQGTSNEVEVGLSGQAFTIGLPATITANVTGNVSGTSGSTTGNAATATALETARTIGGVSFDGTANIDLPGVNTAGNQNTTGSSASTTGNAATATALQTARTIAGKSFDGTGNITIAAGDLSNVSTSGVSDGQVLVYNNSASEFQPGSVGSATALIDGDSDFTLSDGVANGIHYELDNTDMADWNQGGVALTAAGGMFRHNQTQSATFTVAATEGTVLAGPITITGTVTNAGTMVIL